MTEVLRPRTLSPFVAVFAAETPTLAPATHTNSYALGGREVLLVEPATPYEAEQREWLAWARALASAGRTPVAIFATHHHPDHVGGLDVLSRELGLPVWGHAETAARVSTTPFSLLLSEGDEVVLDGPVPSKWTVLHTPGHAPGHLCLFDEASRTLVVGDMVASIGTILIAPGDGDMSAYLRELGRLSSLAANVALPAHGEPIDAPSALFDRYVSHRLMREARVFAAIQKAGPSGATAEELVPDAYADVPEALYPIAALSLAAHAEKLVRDGRVEEKDGRYRVSDGERGETR